MPSLHCYETYADPFARLFVGRYYLSDLDRELDLASSRQYRLCRCSRRVHVCHPAGPFISPLTCSSYATYLIYAVFFMQTSQMSPGNASTKNVNDAETCYSFSTMPASTMTPPSSSSSSQTLPPYTSNAPSRGPSQTSKISRTS